MGFTAFYQAKDITHIRCSMFDIHLESLPFSPSCTKSKNRAAIKRFAEIA
jgi:hypothetical protein